MAKGVYKQATHIDGLELALMKLEKLEKAYGRKGEAVLPTLVKISHLIKKRVEANAPVDESGKPKGINPRTGEPYDHIKNSVVGRAYSKQRPDEPAAYTAIDYKKAPHAHFPEFGTVERVKKTGATTGHMPATPYFRPAVDQNRSKFFNEITKTAKKLVYKAAI